VLSLAAAVQKHAPDLIVTVGGGTPIDTVKVMLLMMAAGVTDEPGFDSVRIRVEANGSRVVPAVKDPPLRQIIVANNVIRSGILKPWRMYRSDTQSQRFIYWPSDWRTGSYSRSHGHDSHAILALAFDGDQGSGPRGRNDLLSQAPALYGRHLYTCAAVSKSLQTNRAMPHDLSARLVEGVKGVQLAELGLKSWSERRWLDVPEIKI
jgi:Iron-containing alcohol dehydrogenase